MNLMNMAQLSIQGLIESALNLGELWILTTGTSAAVLCGDGALPETRLER